MVDDQGKLIGLFTSRMKNRKEIFENILVIMAGGKGKRMMSSKYWRPWMFKLGAQPPHPPIIYRKDFARTFKYDTTHPVIADFDYLERIFNAFPYYLRGGRTIVHMSAGGATSSGVTSFFKVNKEFKKLKGPLRSYIFIVSRPIIKIIQMI